MIGPSHAILFVAGWIACTSHQAMDAAGIGVAALIGCIGLWAAVREG